MAAAPTSGMTRPTQRSAPCTTTQRHGVTGARLTNKPCSFVCTTLQVPFPTADTVFVGTCAARLPALSPPLRQMRPGDILSVGPEVPASAFGTAHDDDDGMSHATTDDELKSTDNPCSSVCASLVVPALLSVKHSQHCSACAVFAGLCISPTIQNLAPRMWYCDRKV